MRVYKIGLGEMLFMTSFILGFICAFYNTTTFIGVYSISFLYNTVRIYMLLAISLKLIYVDRYKSTELLCIFILIIFSLFAYYNSGRPALLEFVLLLVGAKNIEPRKIVSVYFKIGIVFLFVVILCSQVGIIEDYTTTRVGATMLRHGFGIIYSTDFAAHVLFLYLSYHYLRIRKIKLIDGIITIAIVIILDKFCNARLSEGMIIVSFAVLLLYEKRKNIFENRIFFSIAKILGFVCAIFSILITWLYNASNPTMAVLNEVLFSRRLSVGKKVIDLYGFSLFGKKVVMQGMGYKVYEYHSDLGVTYIDSSYLQIAMLYGIVILVIFLIAIFTYTKRIIAEGNTKLVLIICVILLMCIHTQYLIFIAYNPFMIFMGRYLFGWKPDKTLIKKRGSNGK